MLDNEIDCSTVMDMGKPKVLQQLMKSWRATPEDLRLLEELKSELGVLKDSEIVRMGLRALAREQLQSN
jgi:hypothetical protein